MDIIVAKTFLEIIRSGSFIAAANRMHVTQTAVSARMKSLEIELGCQLFIRNRSGAKLTPNGQQFSTYALQLVQTWEKAKIDLPLPVGTENHLTVAAEMPLWNPLLHKWVQEIRQQLPTVVLKVEADMATNLIKKLSRGVLDLAVIHRIEYIPGFQIEQLLEEKLILVKSGEQEAPYVLVDWGEEFMKQHDAAFPGAKRTELSFDFGPVALQFLLASGGSGYFRSRVVSTYLDQGILTKVQHAPEFSYPIYIAYNKQKRVQVLENIIDILKQTAQNEADWSL